MGLLDQVIGNVVGQVLGGGRGGSAMSPIVKALLMLLIAKGASGGFGDIFGGGRGSDGPSRGGGRPDPYPQDNDHQGYGGPSGEDGDLGGFGGRPGGGRDGDYSDLAGMLDGPGERGGRDPGAGPYAQLGSERTEPGGLDGLIDSFERSGLGDVIGSWIGPGQNRGIAPDRLADALGPDTVDALSRQTGLDRSDLLSQLAQALPGVVDGLTPQGRRPDADERRGW